MDAVVQAHLTFHLRGQHADSPLEPADLTDVRPALLARYRHLAGLRYDYPLVLLPDGHARALSGVTKISDRAVDGQGTSACPQLADQGRRQDMGQEQPGGLETGQAVAQESRRSAADG